MVHSVFGMPPKSKFLRFALESARLNFQHEEFKKRIVYLRYGPTFLGKMFFEFHDSTINIIDSRYLIWNQNNNENYMMQVEEKVEKKELNVLFIIPIQTNNGDYFSDQ